VHKRHGASTRPPLILETNIIKPLINPESNAVLDGWHAAEMERSLVVGEEMHPHSARTSYGSWLNGQRRDGRVRAIQHRVHELVGVPEEFGEPIMQARMHAACSLSTAGEEHHLIFYWGGQEGETMP
jgi:hypothetical protein